MLQSAEAVADALIDVYEQRGSENYDESVTQTAHALQCGAHAMAAPASVTTIVAAFLHDIGHLLVDIDVHTARTHGDTDRGVAPQDLRHEDLGARFLATWFPESITEPIRLHVSAKRYLCAIDPEYVDVLSPASIRSMELQGGPMTSAEAERFAALPGSAPAVALRRWDDLAKEVGAPVPSLDTFRTLVESVIVRIPAVEDSDPR